MDLQAKIRAVELTWAEGAWKAADSEVVSRPGWYQVTTPSVPATPYNGVYLSVMDDGEADGVIDSVLEHYRSRGLPFRWTVGPSARPADLAERLKRRGMVLANRTLGMVIPTGAAMPPFRPGITVERVTRESVQAWVQASADGWGITDPAGVAGLEASVYDHMARNPDSVWYVLARVDGEPAGGGALLFVSGFGLFKGTGVRPAFRGQGVYQALVAWRLAALRERGVDWAVIQAVAETSAPICRRLGFEEVCRIDLYHSP